jgi:5-methylcytosine-specific restriction endonuclease McrA
MPRGLRRRIYERDGYACKRCGWTVVPPEGYRGINAIHVVIGHKRVVAYERHSMTGGPSEIRYEDKPIIRSLEIDHIRPYSKGGAFKDPDNLQALCSICNGIKGVWF